MRPVLKNCSSSLDLTGGVPISGHMWSATLRGHCPVVGPYRSLVNLGATGCYGRITALELR